MSDRIPAHIEKITETVLIEVPAHVCRTAESAEFNRNVARLKADGHYQCWACGSTENLQVHHMLIEWSEAENADFTKVQAVQKVFNPYGYDEPLTTVDGIGNLLVLCQFHHTGKGTGIHYLPLPFWWMEKLAKAGVVIIPPATAE